MENPGHFSAEINSNWLEHDRETKFDDLSGFQTVPINWGINTPHKRAFFARLREVTGSGVD